LVDLARGAIPAQEAVEYRVFASGISSIVFGASDAANIRRRLAIAS